MDSETGNPINNNNNNQKKKGVSVLEPSTAQLERQREGWGVDVRTEDRGGTAAGGE